MKTVVLGGGISGLTLSFERLRAGDDVVVLEAGDRVGGLIRSQRRDGYLLELGPNAYVDRDEQWRSLVKDLGLEGEVIRSDPGASKRYVVWNGRLEPVPGSPPALLKSALLSAAGKARLLLEPVLARRSTAKDESLESFGRRHLGREALPLLDAFQTGIFAGRSSELSVHSCFPEWVEAEKQHRSFLVGMARTAKNRTPSKGLASFREGLGQLCGALEVKLSDRIRLNHRVERLTREANGWRLEGSGGSMDADQVVLACGARSAAQLLKPLDPALAELLQGVRYAPMAVIHLGFSRAQIAHPLDGFGFLCGEREQKDILGCVFSSSVFPSRAPEGRALLTLLLGGVRRPELLELDDAALVERALKEVGPLLGIRGEPELTQVVRHPQAIPQYQLGHGERRRAVDERLRSHPGLHLLGTAFGGVGVLDCVREAARLGRQLLGRE